MLVILDRDGVINEDLPSSVCRIAEFRFIDGSREAVAALCKAGHTVVIATNQSIVGKGTITMAELDAIHDHMCRSLREAHGHIAHIYVAPDAPDNATGRRKPGPGMLREAMRDHGAAPEDTVMIGDAQRDLEAARAAGVNAILVATGKGEKTHAALPESFASTPYVPNLAAAVKLVLASATKAD